MPGTFTWFNIKKFPDLSDLITPLKISVTPTQVPIAYQEEEFEQSASSDAIFTEISYRPDNKVSGFDLLRVHHRSPVKVRGWWHNKFITQIVEEEQFDVFFRKNSNCLITNTKKEIGIDAMRSLHRGGPDKFEFSHGKLDFKRLIKECANLKGAWFEKMQYSSIRSEAAYGDRIDKDPEFERLLNHGVLQNIIIDIDYQGMLARVNASRMGSIYFIGEYALDYCLDFWDFISGYFEKPESK